MCGINTMVRSGEVVLNRRLSGSCICAVNRARRHVTQIKGASACFCDQSKGSNSPSTSDRGQSKDVAPSLGW